MKWNDVLLGAVASLAVTVIGGIAVYYLTKEPDQKKTEQLVYTVQQSATFSGGNQNVSFVTVRLKNEGGVAAKRVALSLEFVTAEIKDFALEADSGTKELANEIKPKSKSIQLTFATLLPREAITLNLLLNGPEKPKISVRSDASLGTEQSLDYEASKNKGVSKFLERAVPLTGVLLGLLAAVFLKWSGRSNSVFSNKNNAGFLLLHHGFVDEANTVLTDAIHSGSYDALTLSNLAVCRALKGGHEQAKQLLRAASFHDSNGHIKAVTLFNEALVSLIAGNKDEALAKLKQAIEKSPKHIRRYCQRSIHLDPIRSDPVIFDLIKG